MTTTLEATRPSMTSRRGSSGPWWLFLITGILWLLAAVVVLRFDLTSVAAVGVLLGVVLMVAALNEILAAIAVEGWRWLRWTLAFLLLLGSLWAFVHPIGAFWELASILGLLLVLKGSVDIIVSVEAKPANELWWLGLIVGIFEILLGFWASQQFFAPRATIIILWVGFAALFRGVSEIVLAFGVRRADLRPV